ncbi:MAG: hypothetical protein GY856_42170, partial [bacterium]|nr:hypothetical protein [bacterium]
MAKKRTAKRSGAKTPAPARRRRRLLGIALGLLLVVVAYGIYVKIAVRPEEGLSDVFRLLEEQGYTPNVGLSDLYQPGTVIQTIESGPDGEERRLASPLPFRWGFDCFPDIEPRESPFVLRPRAKGLCGPTASGLLPVRRRGRRGVVLCGDRGRAAGSGRRRRSGSS